MSLSHIPTQRTWITPGAWTPLFPHTHGEVEMLRVLDIKQDRRATGGEVSVQLPAIVHQPVPLERQGGVDLASVHVRDSAAYVV